MSLPYSDPSNPVLPSPLFADVSAARGDHLRANNAAIWGNFAVLGDNGSTLTGTPNTITASGLQQKYICNSASAMVDNLPAASGSGNKFIFANRNNGEVAITPNGTDTINGVNAAWYLYQYEGIELIDAASGAWLIVNKFTMQGSAKAWITGRRYRIGELVISGNFLYTCIVAHTAGTFLTDLAAGYWTNSAMSSIKQHGFLPKSQCVIGGSVNSDGKANFLSVSGNNIAIAATSENILVAYANSKDEYGEKNYIEKISADETPSEWNNCIEVAPNYLYKQLDVTDPSNPVPSYGKSFEPPNYISMLKELNYSLLHFEDASVVLDDYGRTWTKGIGLTRSSTSGQIGSYCAAFDGGGNAYAQSDIPYGNLFTIEGRVQCTTLANSRSFFGCNQTYSVLLRFDTSGKLQLYISSNGSGWDICAGSLSASTFVINTWYHVALVYNGASYKVYVNGNLEITANSALSVYPSLVRIGSEAAGGTPFAGYMDEFRFSPYPRYFTTFTPYSTLRSIDADYYYIPSRKFYSKGTQVVRSYIGETAGSGIALSSVTTYALNARYQCPKTLITPNSGYSFNHNIGVDINKLKFSGWARDIDNGHIVFFSPVTSYDYDGAHNNWMGADIANKNNSIWIRMGSSHTLNYLDYGGTTHQVTGANKSELEFTLERSF